VIDGTPLQVRDDGYGIRFYGATMAIGYDRFHDLITPQLRPRCRACSTARSPRSKPTARWRSSLRTSWATTNATRLWRYRATTQWPTPGGTVERLAQQNTCGVSCPTTPPTWRAAAPTACSHDSRGGGTALAKAVCCRHNRVDSRMQAGLAAPPRHSRHALPQSERYAGVSSALPSFRACLYRSVAFCGS